MIFVRVFLIQEYILYASLQQTTTKNIVKSKHTTSSEIFRHNVLQECVFRNTKTAFYKNLYNAK